MAFDALYEYIDIGCQIRQLCSGTISGRTQLRKSSKEIKFCFYFRSPLHPNNHSFNKISTLHITFTYSSIVTR